MQDAHTRMTTKVAIDQAAIGANGTKTGRIIDRADYGGLEFVVHYGAVTTTGSVCTIVMFEGSVTGTMTSVADADMNGTEALASLLAATPRASGTTKLVSKRVGYKGNKRYVRIDAVGSGTTSVGYVSALALLTSPITSPTTNP